MTGLHNTDVGMWGTKSDRNGSYHMLDIHWKNKAGNQKSANMSYIEVHLAGKELDLVRVQIVAKKWKESERSL